MAISPLKQPGMIKANPLEALAQQQDPRNDVLQAIQAHTAQRPTSVLDGIGQSLSLVGGHLINEKNKKAASSQKQAILEAIAGGQSPQDLMRAAVVSGDPNIMKMATTIISQQQATADRKTDAQRHQDKLALDRDRLTATRENTEATRAAAEARHLDSIEQREADREARQTENDRRSAERAQDRGFKKSEADLKRQTKLQEDRLRDRRIISSSARKGRTVVSSIDEAIKLIDSGGPGGAGTTSIMSVLKWMPFETDAGTLENKLETIKANIGFDKLQEMRDNSKTGGAVGQVSNYENRLLQAVSGVLDQRQTGNLRQTLLTIRENTEALNFERKVAFALDYNEVPAEHVENVKRAHAAMIEGRDFREIKARLAKAGISF